MTWTGKTFNVGALLPAIDLNNLQADISAAMAGDIGAPRSVEESVNEITAGSSYRHASDVTEIITANTSYITTGLKIIVPRSGSYQVSFEMKRGGAGGVAYAKIYRNASTGYTGDAALGTEQTSVSTSYATKTETLSLNAGDVITLYAHDDAIAISSDVKNFRIESAVKLFG